MDRLHIKGMAPNRITSYKLNSKISGDYIIYFAETTLKSLAISWFDPETITHLVWIGNQFKLRGAELEEKYKYGVDQLYVIIGHLILHGKMLEATHLLLQILLHLRANRWRLPELAKRYYLDELKKHQIYLSIEPIFLLPLREQD